MKCWPMCDKCDRGIMTHYLLKGRFWCQESMITEGNFTPAEQVECLLAIGRKIPQRLKDISGALG